MLLQLLIIPLLITKDKSLLSMTGEAYEPLSMTSFLIYLSVVKTLYHSIETKKAYSLSQFCKLE